MTDSNVIQEFELELAQALERLQPIQTDKHEQVETKQALERVVAQWNELISGASLSDPSSIAVLFEKHTDTMEKLESTLRTLP